MTEEERFQKIYNVYMNYEHELAQRGMEDVAPIAAGLTTGYVLHDLLEGLRNELASMRIAFDHLVDPKDLPSNIYVDEIVDSINDSINMFEIDSKYEVPEEWDTQP